MNGISITNLSVSYGDNKVFEGFEKQFEQNKIHVLLGGSGVGKTTLLNAIAGLIDYGGKIERADGDVSYIFQNDRLIPSISVYKNLDLVLRATMRDKDARRDKIMQTLKLLEIEGEAKKLPTELSGGQRQRVAMARAYIYDSSCLLLDEPFKALDPALKDRLIKALIALNERTPRTVIFVTHAIDECLLLADTYTVLKGKPAIATSQGEITLDKASRRLDSPQLIEHRQKLLAELYD